MSIYSRITFLSEGEQADAYKARKAKEKEEKEREAQQNFDRRYLTNGRAVMPDSVMSAATRNYEKGGKDKENAALQNSGISKNDIERMRRLSKKFEKDGYDNISEEDAKFLTKLSNNPNFKKAARESGQEQEVDAIYKHMRRHPDRWDGDKLKRESSLLFESVQFI